MWLHEAEMPTRKLTASFVKFAEVEPGKSRTIWWDTELKRFGLMVMSSGHKSYVLQYRDRLTRKQSRMSWPEDAFDLKRMREVAKLQKAEILLGGNPLRDRRKVESDKQTVFRVICENYLRQVGSKLRSVKLIERALERQIYPALWNIQISEIKRSDIKRMMDKIAEDAGPGAADFALSITSRIMNWHARNSDTFTPITIKGMALLKAKERARTRILSDDELRAVWRATEGGAGPFPPLLRFILLTACRRNEAARMSWREVVGSDWIIPASRYKTKTEILLPLSKAAQDMLAGMPRVAGSDFVFNTGKGPITQFSTMKAALDRASGVSDWTIHDLRRTARSLMSRAGVQPDHAERCLGHVVTGIRGTYDRHAFRDEKLAAFEALAALVDRIVNPADNVVQMRTEIPA
jgi:integrase